MTVALNKFIGQYGTQWEKLMAVSTTIALPIIAIFAALQRYIISGLVVGSVNSKGREEMESTAPRWQWDEGADNMPRGRA